jgi:hypothetical protein
MRTIGEFVFRAVLLTALACGLMWLFTHPRVDSSNLPRVPAQACLTEDQPGTCVWEGHERTYTDNINIQR